MKGFKSWSKIERKRKRDDKNKRIEYRPPDPTANPYLALAALFLAGLDGILKKIDPGDPVIELSLIHI